MKDQIKLSNFVLARFFKYNLFKNTNMSNQTKKQFGIWMDSHHAIVTGRENVDSGEFVILDHVKNEGPSGNSSENAANHQEITLTHKFFKEIVANIPNMDEVHVTGTGQIQKQFIRFLEDSAHYKNVVASESTSTKMGDEQLLTFVDTHFN